MVPDLNKSGQTKGFIDGGGTVGARSDATVYFLHCGEGREE